MKKRIISMLLVGAILFSGCSQSALNTTQTPETQQTSQSPETVEIDEIETDDSVEEKESSMVSTEDSSETQIIHEDTDKRGNSVGNLINFGFACSQDNDFVFYNRYMNSVGEYSRLEDFSEYVFPSSLYYINIYDGFLYGVSIVPGTTDSVLIKQNLENYECEIIRENAYQLSIVNDLIYYTDEKGQLFSFPLEGGEETRIIPVKTYQPCVYKDKVYYINEADGFKIYECDLSGANPKKLFNGHATNIIVYKDYIYFSEEKEGKGSLRRIAIEDTSEEILTDAQISCMNVYDDKLYFADANDLEYINYIDIADEELAISQIKFKDGLLGYYHDCEGDDQNTLEVSKYEYMNFADDFMYLNAYFIVDGKECLASFCYDLHNYSIPSLLSQPNEKFDFEKYDVNEVNWILADNEEVYEKITGKTVNINYTDTAQAKREELEANGEHLSVEKLEQEKSQPGSANVSSLDEATVQAAIMALQSTYPDGMGWGMEKYAEFHGGLYCGGYACAAFAITISDAVFGTLPARKYYDVNAIRIGDVVNYITPFGIGHSVVVTSVNGDSVTVCEGNLNGQVHWGRTISKSELQASLIEIWTRYQ